MSFYMSTVYPDRVELLTDAAGWDNDGVLRTVRSKVTVVPGYPVAITSRGIYGRARRITDLLIEMVQRAGSFDLAMELLAEGLPTIKRAVPAGEAVDFCIAGHSPEAGFAVYTFRTADEPPFVEGWKLYASTETVVCGIDGGRHGRPDFHRQFLAAGTLRESGVKFVEMFRRAKNTDGAMAGLSQEAYCNAGGFLELTTVTADGVRTERIHEWDDRVGERADPFRSRPNVAAFPAMSRQQRRAAERESRKRRA